MLNLNDENNKRENDTLHHPEDRVKERYIADFPLQTSRDRMGTAEESRSSTYNSRADSSRTLRPSSPESILSTDLPGGSSLPAPPQPAQLSGRTSTGLRVAVFMLVLAISALAGYVYYSFSKNGMALSQFPETQHLVTMLVHRMDGTEAQLRDLKANWEGVADRVSNLDKKLNSSLRLAAKQSQSLIAKAQEQMRAEMDQREQVVNARLAGIESEQTAQRARLTKLQDQVQSDLATVREETAAGWQDAGQDIATLRQQVRQNQGTVQSLTQKLEVSRADFEATKKTPTELAPGVSLTVLKTNVSYQRFAGYLSLTAEGRTLWLHDAGADESVKFYSQRADRPYDLVVTSVNKRGVVGYLLVPLADNQAGKEAARNPNTSPAGEPES